MIKNNNIKKQRNNNKKTIETFLCCYRVVIAKVYKLYKSYKSHKTHKAYKPNRPHKMWLSRYRACYYFYYASFLSSTS